MVKALLERAAHVQAKLTSEFGYRAILAKHKRQLPPLSPADRQIVEILRRDGVYFTSLAALALPSTPQLLAAAQALRSSLTATSLPKVDYAWHVGNHAVQASSAQIAHHYPELYWWGLQERLLNLVENYLGLPATYFGVDIRKDLKGLGQIGTRQWHLDSEDRRVVKIMIHLTDVDANCGPFEYIPKALTPSVYPLLRHVESRIRLLDQGMQQAIPQSAWRSCLGPAGTVMIADTACLWHHGKVPKAERQVLYFTYTSRWFKKPELAMPYAREDRLLLSRSLSERQRACVFWEQEVIREKS